MQADSLPAELPEKRLSFNDLWYLNEGEVGLLKNNEYHTSILALNIGSVQFSRSVVSDCDPMNYTVHGILQARILEWVTSPFSKGSSQPRD